MLQVIIYCVVFIFLRSITGGYHASSYLKCNVIFSLITILVIFLSKIVAEIHITATIIVLLFLPSVLIFIWLAPVENVNKPIKEKRQVHLKIISILVSTIFFVLSLFLYINHHNFESAIIIITIFVVSILCFVTTFQKGE